MKVAFEQPVARAEPLAGTVGPRAAAARLYALLALAILSLLAVIVLPHQWPVLAPIHLVIMALLLYSNLWFACGWYGPVVTRFRTKRREVWLTIDDGPHPETTPGFLELLKRFDARATFFVVGDRVRAHPELAQAILNQGHQLANHSATHPSATFWALAGGAAERQIAGGAAEIRAATGQDATLFRAPVGMANYFVRGLLRARGWPLIGWTTRGFDTGRREPQSVAARILRSVGPGAIIVLHERARGGGVPGEASLEAVLARLRQAGYACVIPSEADWDDAREEHRVAAEP